VWGGRGAGLPPGAVDFLLKLRERAADVFGEAVCRAGPPGCGVAGPGEDPGPPIGWMRMCGDPGRSG